MGQKNTPLNIEEIKAKYGKIYEIAISIEVDDLTTESKTYIFKKPTMISYDRYIKSMSNSVTKASKAFCVDNIIDEYVTQFEADVEEYPAIVMTLIDKLFSMLGLSKDVGVKKL